MSMPKLMKDGAAIGAHRVIRDGTGPDKHRANVIVENAAAGACRVAGDGAPRKVQIAAVLENATPQGPRERNHWLSSGRK